ncbi:MAG: DUF1653 domain-containing protein [Patescibacteria group bacterium]
MEIKQGTYEHYKGKRYEVIGVATHSESLEELVVYRALYGEGELWVRPVGMFLEKVEHNGKEVPRFTYVGK